MFIEIQTKQLQLMSQNKEYENKGNIPENILTHIAEDRENRYVANHEMIGNTPVTAKADRKSTRLNSSHRP